jgi:SepF-like predicted cell division protein (DUF552 family)
MKSRLAFKRGDEFWYTLGQISSDYKKVVCIKSALISEKDDLSLATSLSEYKITSNIVLIDLSELKKLKPYSVNVKLEIGSKCRYEQESYEVAGIFKNKYAQTFIKSPILIQPFVIFNDVVSMLYSTMKEDDILEKVNKNFKDGKYDSDILFRFINADNYKDKIYGVKLPPPKTTLEEVKLGTTAVSGSSETQNVEGLIGMNRTEFSFIDSKIDVEDLYEMFKTNSTSKLYFSNLIGTDLFELPKGQTLYNGIEQPKSGDSHFEELSIRGVTPLSLLFSNDSQYETFLGNITSEDYRNNNRVVKNIGFSVRGNFPDTILNILISSIVFLGGKDIEEFFQLYVNVSRYGRPSFYMNYISPKDSYFSAIEGTKIGSNIFSSKLPLKDFVSSEDYEQLLDFGSVVYVRGASYYVIRYYSNVDTKKILL